MKPHAQKVPFWVEQLADGLNFPWSMAWLPDGRLLIVERFGGLRIFARGALDSRPVPGTPVAFQEGKGGLLDIALDPDFARTGFIFLSYTEGDDKANHAAVYRARLSNDRLVDGKTIFRSVPDKPHSWPIGGRLLFLPDKTLLFSILDEGLHGHLVQQLDNDFGKIVRINRDGSACTDNPFVSKAGSRKEIFSYGHRAPQGLFRDPRDGTIWATEHGPMGGDELNIIRKGANYGWPLVTYGMDYSGSPVSDRQEMPGMAPPLLHWTPSIAPSGLTLYLGDRFPGWRGDLFLGALAGRHLRRVRMAGGKVVQQEVLLADLEERIRDVRTGPDGLLYILTDNAKGRLLRLRPGSADRAEMIRIARPLPRSVPPTVDSSIASRIRTEGDAAKGRRAFAQQCAGCHSVDAGDSVGMAPNLSRIINRRFGSESGFQYSDAMRHSTGFWNPMALDVFLSDPKAYLPGTTMSFDGIPDQDARLDMIAFLRSLGTYQDKAMK